MKKLIGTLDSALYKYYQCLIFSGYFNYKEVNNLLIASFLEDILSRRFSDFITNKDIHTIAKAFYCLNKKSSLQSYPIYTNKSFKEFAPRLSEAGMYRLSESLDYRIKE
jgi:hypothetical protein